MSHIHPDFPEPYESPADGLRGKTSIFSHPVYLFLREFSLQDFRGGSDRNQDPFIWGAILGEEVGEFHQAVLHDRFGGKAAGTSREEAVQIAAVALQIIEYYDRVID
ncbi:MazG-like family protein [Escherichia coli]|nr:MazG-like family protein [Escherichia coli]